MNERANILKVSAIIASFSVILCLIFIVIISVINNFIIYPYLGLLIAMGGCAKLWKMYIDEKKHNGKSV